MDDTTKCPVSKRAHTNRDWWPNQLDLGILHQHSNLSNPMGEAFDYAKEFRSLDLNAGRPILVTMEACSFGWPGTPQAPTASVTAAAAPAPASSGSHLSTVGRITPISTRRGVCSGRSSRNTAAKSPGPT